MRRKENLIMSNQITLHACDLDGFLTEKDKADLAMIENLYSESLKECAILEKDPGNGKALEALSLSAKRVGDALETITKENSRIHVYSFETPKEMHAECSRLVAKLRCSETGHEEFIYYVQRAYELMFSHAFLDPCIMKKRSLIEETPVSLPIQNFAVHRIPDIDHAIENSVMCVMLRGALLPSMIISKEIEDYSSSSYITPFALFRIKRDDRKHESDMAYVLDFDKSYFDLDSLDGRDLIFADPMNATGGSLVTIVKYLKDQGIRPKSIKFINVIAALKGSLRITRAIEEAEVFTLWMDPMLNDRAYILPGLGDAGDRLNGLDDPKHPRNIIQLIADYGTQIVNLYRNQVREIEKTVLG